jgi:hypothetical protein
MSFEDDKRVEDVLKRALKPADPGEAFTRRVLDRLQVGATSAVSPVREGARPSPAPASPTRVTWRVALPFAASLAIAMGGAAWVQHARYVEEGERARAQVLTALRLTSEKLNVVRSAVIEAQEH